MTLAAALLLPFLGLPAPFALAAVLLGTAARFAAVIPSVVFCLWCVPLFRGSPIPRKRTGAAWAVVAVLSAGWFWAGWHNGVRYQGYPYTLTTALISLLCAVVLGGMLSLRRRTDSIMYSLASNFLLFAWAPAFAFPWIGEMI